MYRFIEKIEKLPISLRKLIWYSIDIFFIFLSLKSLSWILEEEDFFTSSTPFITKFFIFTLPIIYTKLNLYSSLTRYFGVRAIYKLIFGNFIYVLLLFVVSTINNLEPVNLNSFFCLFILLTAYTGFIRIILKDSLLKKSKSLKKHNLRKIVICGAEEMVAQFGASISLVSNYDVLHFIDDSASMQGRNINGISIKSSSYLKNLTNKIDKVIIIKDNFNKKEIRKLINQLNSLDLRFMILPSIKNLIDGNVNFESLKNVEIEDLLGRDPVSPNKYLMSKCITENVILVTGAGGSIGSEICRLIINHKPKKIILIDINEYNLYRIDLELRNYLGHETKIKTILGSVTNRSIMNELFSNNIIDIVFHAAAYKHVPLIENNPLQGIENNILSTKIICEVAHKFNTKKVMLISSDKAVRPTNIMGATKRISELIFLEKAINFKKDKTCFSIVRFGNVLGSSGSVVPLFKDQISKGGPITITHPDVTRYFMTIREASELVIQATSMAKSGEIFLLDMGEPLKILDLAKQMIILSGLKIKNEKNMAGDIEIITTGMRAGEKLYEELLIDGKSRATDHPLIFKAEELVSNINKIKSELENLFKNIEKRSLDEIIKTTSELIPEWKKSSNIKDILKN